jgi:hypothetical protein
MTPTQEHLLDELLQAAKSLAPDKLLEALDFIGYLRYRGADPQRPERGSAQALLPHVGTFHFGSGELDQLLADIAHMRALDMERYA